MFTVLLVDDDDALRELMQIGLGDYHVIESRDASGALSILRSQHGKIDLLLVDAGLPDLKGWDLANLARQLRPGIKCVIISGNPVGSDSAPHRFLAKPFQLTELHALVTEVLGASEDECGDGQRQAVDEA